jgi:hypothetical protein
MHSNEGESGITYAAWLCLDNLWTALAIKERFLRLQLLVFYMQ